MAMQFGKVSNITVGDITKTTVKEGGAVVGGIFGAGILGKQIEKLVKPDVDPLSSGTDKLLAWTGNNIPKVLAWYLVKKEGKQVLGEYTEDVSKGVISSVVLDTAIRAGNDYAPQPGLLTIFGIDVLGTGKNVSTPQVQENLQKVISENSSLRQQLNSALQRIASAPTQNISKPASIGLPPPDHDRAYGMMQTTPESEDRRKKYGAMTPPIEEERNRKFGSMNKADLNFAGETNSVATDYGML